MSTCTQVLWGDHSVHSSGWQTWGKVSVLGSIPFNGLFQPLNTDYKATISQQGQQSPEHAQPSLTVCACSWLGGFSVLGKRRNHHSLECGEGSGLPEGVSGVGQSVPAADRESVCEVPL